MKVFYYFYILLIIKSSNYSDVRNKEKSLSLPSNLTFQKGSLFIVKCRGPHPEPGHPGPLQGSHSVTPGYSVSLREAPRHLTCDQYCIKYELNVLPRVQRFTLYSFLCKSGFSGQLL